MMLLRLLATAAFTLTALPLAAECTGVSYMDTMTDPQRDALDAIVAEMPYAEGLTYLAERGNDRITLIGTMHIYDPRLEIIRARTAGFVREAELVMLEATEKEEAELQALIAAEPERVFIVDGPTLPEILDEDVWQMIVTAATERGIPGFMAAKMQPWYLSLALAIPPCAMGDMAQGARGLDHMIAADAKAAGVPLKALEPYTTLFDLFDDAPVDEQIDMLRVNMLAPELQQQMFVAMLDRYFAEDVGRLWEMGRIAMQDIPDIDPAEGDAMFLEMQEALLDTRNGNWIPVIYDALDTSDRIVVAVGAAHLIGEAGLVQRLADDGWTVTRIP